MSKTNHISFDKAPNGAISGYNTLSAWEDLANIQNKLKTIEIFIMLSYNNSIFGFDNDDFRNHFMGVRKIIEECGTEIDVIMEHLEKI